MSAGIRSIVAQDFYGKSSVESRIKFLLGYGVLAPSTHNSQPWKFKIHGESCEIYADFERYSIIRADPIRRDLYISFGCLLENINLAAASFDVPLRIDYVCDEKTGLIARLDFSNIMKKDNGSRDEKILEAMLHRVNARGLFDATSLPEGFAQRIRGFNALFPGLELKFIEETSIIKKIGDLTARGLKLAYADSLFRKEMSGWFIHNLSSRLDGIPGYSLRMPLLMSVFFPIITRYLNLGGFVGKLNAISISSASGAIVINAARNEPKIWLDVGRLAERIMLEAHLYNLKTSIFVASIEMGDLYKELQGVVGTSLIPQFHMVIGKMNYKQRPNPRHPVESKMIY